MAARRAAAQHPAILIVFDVLPLDGRAVRSLPWYEHKHRRTETLAVSAWTPGDHEPDTFFVTRTGADGEPDVRRRRAERERAASGE